VEESATLGHLLAAKVNAATGPVAVLLPLRGLSKYEAAGGPYVDPLADEALFAAIREDLRPGVTLEEVDANVNDEVFADRAASAFVRLWTASGRPLPELPDADAAPLAAAALAGAAPERGARR
jgi:uncharacterized protein (UPF0261 family)